MSDSDLLALVDEILEVPPGTVTMDSDLEELGWDSLSNLNFISIVDTRYRATVDPVQLARSATPRDLMSLL